ncbi:DUF2188 domain-containing protein [Bacillus shivajii]|uniref:DUF2188 domain-containing protein n=1 Tax=Bacillus shivajii TaxID=1983719 RepID=UPI001CFC43B7|nr:DUF2188 domain-containing protein [Bacillus shivajii]UCZ54423.1 DUF2188 domain-containing protein [Bacillus shivajii]
MPWDTNNYPSSMKNLKTGIRKKAIEIANAMINEGYTEDRAIPIAIEQGKEWYSHANDKEKNMMVQKSDNELRSQDEDNRSGRPELLDKGEHVLSHEEGWAVQAEDAKKPSEVFKKKQDAVDRATEIAKNKGTHLIVHDQDGSVRKKQSFDEQ